MCIGSKSKLSARNSNMEGKSNGPRCSILLELSASDDLIGFRNEVEVMGSDIDEASYWYGRKIGSKKMGYEERTPLLIASMYGSTNILKYVIETRKVDLNRPRSSDKVSPLHCAVAGSSNSIIETIKLLLNASADPNRVDSNGKKPIDLLKSGIPTNPRRKLVESLLKGENPSENDEENPIPTSHPSKEGVAEKKEYPIDVSLPDINNGIYGTDEFRMFCFKVKPCSRAYSHDWTECPFVHPGENARRRDPKKFPYSCVPCPEFRKGTCQKGDNCEYAHGVFESWLHPAQYRTRLCKDETGCARKVCFFAHKTEELRPVYASTGSAMPSPKSMSAGSMDMASLTPPMSPKSWPNKVNLTPPALQLPGSRLKSAISARDFDFDLKMELKQQLLDEISGLASPSHWSKDFNMMGESKPANLDEVFGMSTQLQSPVRQNVRSSYPPAVPLGFDSRSTAFANRSHSFVDRGAASPNRLGLTAAANSVSMMTSASLSGWSSPNGKLDWGVQGGELNKLRKSASFGFRSNNSPPRSMNVDEPDVSWVNSLVKDAPAGTIAERSFLGSEKGVRESMPPWMEQMCIEQEQMVA